MDGSIVGIIPARKGSKRLKDKNRLEWEGLPLMAYAFKKLSSIVPTWMCTDYEAQPNIELPYYMHNDEYSVTLKIKYAAEQLAKKGPIKTVVALMCTNPLITTKDINTAINRFNEDGYKILRSYHTCGQENGLYIIDYEYLTKSHIYAYDIYTGCIWTSGYEIHTEEDYENLKSMYL